MHSILDELNKRNVQAGKQPGDRVEPGSVQPALQAGQIPPVDAQIQRQTFLGESGLQAQFANCLGKGPPDLNSSLCCSHASILEEFIHWS